MVIVTRIPEEIVAVIDRAARKKLLQRATYIRQVLLDRLEADGFLKDGEPKENKKS